MSSRFRIILSLCLTYFTFAILLNSVGTVILQVISTYGVSKTGASVLEGCKDLPIAIVSFLVASSLPRFGLRRAMMAAHALVMVACVAMPLLGGFAMTKLLFVCVGVAFALVKVSVYASIGLLTNDRQSHASLLSSIEGVFMVGVLSGYWVFSFFIDDQASDSHTWLNVYWLLALMCAANIALLATSPLDESAAKSEQTQLRRDFADMFRLLALPLVTVFIISAFLYVLIEQGIGTWLPTFNHQILGLPPAMSVQATSIFAATLALGRLGAGQVLRHVHWYKMLTACLLAMAVLIVLTMPLARDVSHDSAVSWLNAPAAAYLFPLIGLFMAPIYPAINSVVLGTLPTSQHAAMTGLIVIFSALGGTFGSFVTGQIFNHFDGQSAFYMALVPITGMLVSLNLFHRRLAAA